MLENYSNSNNNNNINNTESPILYKYKPLKKWWLAEISHKISQIDAHGGGPQTGYKASKFFFQLIIPFTSIF